MSRLELPNRFDHAELCPGIYARWEREGRFDADPSPDRRPFSMVIPPPNVTGALHLGHALNNTLQDIQVRMRRMQGYSALWVPGTDHAGIATQAVVERRLREEEGKTRNDLGRDELVRRIWDWKNQYEKRILGQLKRLGCSCDWRRTRFTLDAVCAKAVRRTFFDLFQKELIFRGKRLVNWDTFLQTAVSDDEVFTESVAGHLWHFRYPVIDPLPGEPPHVTIATTRPETMLGDTAVAVHPEPGRALDRAEADLTRRRGECPAKERPALDDQLDALRRRRGELIPHLECLAAMARRGCRLRLPLVDREIPLVADAWAKPEMGSGCVKITPAHDANDYEVGRRCALPMVNILRPDGTLNENAGPFRGLSIADARRAVIQAMDERGLVEKIEPHTLDLPHSDRSKTPIEPYLADQWFVRMAELAQSAMDAVADGRVRIVPARYAKGYHDWLAEKRDWPVSRQLWWGHQIPVWTRPVADASEFDDWSARLRALPAHQAGRIASQIERPSGTSGADARGAGLLHVCVRDDDSELEGWLVGNGFVREEDVLDTWFSSALWPHSTLGWPDATPELAYYYPTSILITSRDIITLWVARMVLTGLNNMGDVPFREVFVHPKILDGDGETMSKSKGNGIDPLDIIAKFGPDALRFGMAHLTTETQDVRMPVEFECPHCEAAVKQTRENRTLPRLDCPHCGRPFATQWASNPEDAALPRAAAVSERFEQARNFCNKLWNASRFALLHLEDYQDAPVGSDAPAVEDHWILSRLGTVTRQVTGALQSHQYAEATRILYGFAWDELCGFYVEMLKDRFQDAVRRPIAQRVLAHALDVLLRLLHPIIPFITEEIWRLLGTVAPRRGLTPTEASPSIMVADWPVADPSHANPAMESRFAVFQAALGGVREIRSRQNIPPKDEVEFSVRCDDETARSLDSMRAYFGRMANARAIAIGSAAKSPAPNAAVSLPNMEIQVDLRKHINVDAERARLERQSREVDKQVAAKRAKLANAAFVDRAPADIVRRERESLAELETRLAAVRDSLDRLRQLGSGS